MDNASVVFGSMLSPDQRSQSTSKVGTIPTDVLKSVLIIALLAITLVSSLIPFALRRAAISHGSSVRRRHIFAGVFSLLSCFGGGVFLATCLLDLLPDTRELIGSGLEQLAVRSNFPLAEFFVAIGFFIVLFIEQIVLWFREKRDSDDDQDTASDQWTVISGGGDERSTPGRVFHRRHTIPASHRSAEGPLATITNVPRRRRHSKPKDPASVGVRAVETTNGDAGSSPSGSASQEDGRPSMEQRAPSVVVLPNPSVVVDDVSALLADEAIEDIESIRTNVHFDPESHSTFRALMLVVALSTHAVFEGLALGLQVDAAVALQIFGALCIHKCVIAFSLGMRLVQSRLTTISIVGCCLLFCVSTVVGGFIGLAITESIKSSSAAMVNGGLQGLACGTFLYITAFEILPHELNDEGNRLAKLVMLLLGFAVICTFVLLYPNA